LGPRDKKFSSQSKEVQNFYLSDVTEVIKQLRLRWVKHVEWIGEMRDA
jgi:hypothetical protein